MIGGKYLDGVLYIVTELERLLNMMERSLTHRLSVMVSTMSKLIGVLLNKLEYHLYVELHTNYTTKNVHYMRFEFMDIFYQHVKLGFYRHVPHPNNQILHLYIYRNGRIKNYYPNTFTIDR